jgi:predicted nucleic acid-binding protein
MNEAAETNKITAVSNTGPLISAFQCGRTNLLKRYLSVIYITTSELTELDKHSWTDEIRELISEGSVVVVSELTEQEKGQAENVAKRIATDPTSRDLDWHNHLPEAEAIVLVKQRAYLMIDQILLDEKAARKVAHELGLSITGFPGVIGRAGLDGILTKDEIRQLLRICQQQGTR